MRLKCSRLDRTINAPSPERAASRIGALKALLLFGMALMIPCYLFTVGNVLFSPWTLYGRNRIILCLLTALCTAGLLLAFAFADRHEAFFLRHEKKALLIAAVFYFVAQMALAQALRYVPVTDAEQCMTAAQLIVDTGTFGDNERSWIYFTRYPHNLGLVYVLAGIFRFFGFFGWTDRYTQAVLVSSVLFTLGLLAGARVCRRLGGVRAQTRMLILCASCLPFLYCTTELYTDAFSLSFPAIILYCHVRMISTKTRRGHVLWGLLFALAAFTGAQIRFTAVIAAIGCLIALLFQKRLKPFLLATAAILVVFISGNMWMSTQTARHLDPEDVARYKLPELHYIAMGLPIHEDEGYGQYGYGGWLVFSTSFDDPQERDAALLEEIIDRVYYLRYPSRMLNMMSRKNLSTFGSGTFSLNEIIEADEHEANHPIKQIVFEGGALYPAYYHLTTALFLSQMLIACLACAQAIRRRDTSAAPLFISLLGIFLLLCIWETRARYFFHFEMALLCAGALFSFCRTERDKKDGEFSHKSVL